MALTPDQVNAFLSREFVDAPKIIDDFLLGLKSQGEKLPKTEAERALRKLTREAQKRRKVEVMAPLMASFDSDEQERADKQWLRLSETAFECEPTLVTAVLRHCVWQVKRKSLGLPVKHHLMPVVTSSLQGSGKTTFVLRFVAPLKELAAGPALLSDFADPRSGDIYRYPVVILVYDMEAIPPPLVPVLKSLMTSGCFRRRRFHSGMSVAIWQLSTLIGTANSGITQLVSDETGHRRFAVLEFRNGEVAKGGDARVWAVVNDTDYVLLWRTVDVYGPSPIVPLFELLFRHQAHYRPQDPLKCWLEALDTESESVRRITTRHGLRAKGLYDLYVLETVDPMELSKFGIAMKTYAAKPEARFGAKVRNMHGIFYPLRVASTSR